MEHGSTYKNRRSGVQRSWAGEGGGKKVVKVIQERGIKLSGKNLRDVEITRGEGRCWICNLTRIGNLSLSLSSARIRKSKGLPPLRVCHVNFGDSVNKGIAAKCNQI